MMIENAKKINEYDAEHTKNNVLNKPKQGASGWLARKHAALLDQSYESYQQRG